MLHLVGILFPHINDDARSKSHQICKKNSLTLILLTCRIWWAPNNASRWQMGFNSAFKGL